MKKINWEQEFPEVPDMVHQSVLDTLSVLDKQEVSRLKKSSKKRILLLAAAMTALIGTTAAAAGIFKWNERAGQVFPADEATQNELTMEQVAQDVSQTVTDQGLTITAVQTIQDKNRFYALFEVTAEDTSLMITDEMSLESTMDYGEGEPEPNEDKIASKMMEDASPFCALSWGFVSNSEQEISNTRYFEIYGLKREAFEGDLNVKIHFHGLYGEPTEKAGLGNPIITGDWVFDLDVHETEMIRYDLNTEYQISGYPMLVKAVELSPVSLSIWYDGDDVRSMEAGEGVNLAELDSLLALWPTGIRYSDGTEITVSCFPMSEGFYEDGTYKMVLAPEKVINSDQILAILMGEDAIIF